MKKTTLLTITLLFLFPYFGNAQWYTGLSFDAPIRFNDNQFDLGRRGTIFLRYDLKNNMIIQFEKGFYKKQGEQSNIDWNTVSRVGYNFQIKNKKKRLSFPSYFHLGTHNDSGNPPILYWGFSTNAFYHINNKIAVFGGIQQSFSIKRNRNQPHNFSYFSIGIAFELNDILSSRRK